MALYRGPGGAGDATNDATSQAILAAQSAQEAAASEAAAASSASTAATSASNAASSATSAASSATSASNSASSAATQAANAASSAATATTKASEAADSATAAASSATTAATSATNASNSATAAANSATSASNSASAASTSATNAATYASNAATSATNAAASETNAAASDNSASTSATSAAASATSAGSSASSATTSATNAASSASAAATSASAASTSATNAANSASSASTSATNAANSATAAANSATAAAGSATSAAGSATSAASSASDAADSASEAAGYAASINPADLVHISGTETITGSKTFSTNPTISSGTAKGVAYLNGSKVLTTGSALTFDGSNLGLGVTPSAWGSAYKVLELGRIGTNVFSNSSNGNIGLFTNVYINSGGTSTYANNGYAAQFLTKSSDGGFVWNTAPSGTAGNAISFTQAMTLDASGNLGIGTSSPQGNLALKAASGNTNFAIESAASSRYFISVNDASNYLAIGGNGATAPSSGALNIDSSGNVGIGTSSPNAQLHVSYAGQTGIQISNTSATPSSWLTQVLDGGSIRWYSYTASAERMRIDSSGNVGIGTSSPSHQLDVANGARAKYVQILNNGYAGSAATTPELYSPASATLAIGAGGSERMRIDSSGNLLVGTTSTLLSNRKLQVDGGGLIAGMFKSSGNEALDVWRASASGSLVEFGAQTSYTTVGTISTNGTSTSYNTSSDYRLKENIEPMQNALAVVQQLNPVTYTWKADGSDGQGFIAHELQAVVPDCVTGEKDAVRIVDVLDDEGRKIGTKEEPVYQGIDTSFLVATLCKAIQELEARVKQLEGK